MIYGYKIINTEGAQTVPGAKLLPANWKQVAATL